MSIRIRLDAGALEKVLSAMGPEQRLELQQCVVEEVMKRHVKAIINTDFARKVKSSCLNLARELIIEEFGPEFLQTWHPKLPEAIKERAALAVREQIDELLKKTVKETLENLNLIDIVQQQLKAAVAQEIKWQTRKRLKELLKEADKD